MKDLKYPAFVSEAPRIGMKRVCAKQARCPGLTTCVQSIYQSARRGG